MIVTPFALQDYAEIDMANEIGLENWGLRNGVVPILQAMSASKTFWTLRDDKGILLIGGYHNFCSGVCEAALFPSKRFVQNPRAAYRLLKQQIIKWTSEFKRVQLNCRSEEKFIRFAKHLGFEEEGVLRKYDHQDRDHILMAIVRKT